MADPIRAVSTHVIAGPLAERRAQIAALLATRPALARWAILVANGPLGGARVDIGDAADQVFVRSAPIGCFGCMPEVPMRVALNRLLREARPARLIIEVESIDERERARAMATSPAFAEVLALEPEP